MEEADTNTQEVPSLGLSIFEGFWEIFWGGVLRNFKGNLEGFVEGFFGEKEKKVS